MRRSLARLARAAAVLGTALASACVTPGPPPREGLRAAPEQRARVESWLAQARQDMEQRRSVRAFVKLRIEAERGKGSAKAVIAAERPDRLRLETLNLLGQTQSLLVVDGESFTYFEGGAIERGVTDRDVLRLRLGMDMEPSEAVALLLAAPTWPEQAPTQIWAVTERAAAEAEGATAAAGVATADAAAPSEPAPSAAGPAYAGEQLRAEFPTRSVRFSGDGTLQSVSAIDAGGALRWEAQFAGWREVNGGRYPSELAVEFPETGLRAKLSIDEIQLNTPLDPKLFRAGKGPDD